PPVIGNLELYGGRPAAAFLPGVLRCRVKDAGKILASPHDRWFHANSFDLEMEALGECRYMDRYLIPRCGTQSVGVYLNMAVGVERVALPRLTRRRGGGSGFGGKTPGGARGCRFDEVSAR